MGELQKNGVFQNERVYYGLATKSQRFLSETRKKRSFFLVSLKNVDFKGLWQIRNILSHSTEYHEICSNHKFLRILSSLQWCLFETSRIPIIEIRDFSIFMY